MPRPLKPTLLLSDEMTFAADGSVTGGIASRTVVPSTPLNGGAFSFSGWVICSNPHLNHNRIFDLATGQNDDNILLKFDQTGSKMRYEVWRGAVMQGGISTTSIFPTQQWVLVQLIHRADQTAEIYWDGVLKVTGKLPLPLVTRRTWYIGRSHWSATDG